jgi:hypothetical protein
MGDNVNHPEHYQNIAGVEAIDILNDMVKDLPGKQAVMLWNAMKYLFRFQKKNGVEDLKKARNYLDYLINDIEAVQEAAKDISEKYPGFLSDKWHSNAYGNMSIFAKSKEPNGIPSKLIFDTEYAAEEFRNVFYRMISEGYDEFSIADVALEMKFKVPKITKWDLLANWKEVHDSFSIEKVYGKYELIFNYKDSSSETTENTKPEKGPCVVYESKISGHAEVYSSTNMYAGMCTKIAFTSDLCRDMFIASFFNKLTSKDYKTYSIRYALYDANYIIPPDTTDEFWIEMPWKDIFNRFKMYTEDDKYVLEFVYKEDALEDTQPEKDKCIVYKSTVWGTAEVCYSPELLDGTCTKILFDDKGGRNTFAIEFFRWLGCHDNCGFSIRDILEDAKYLFPKEDDSFSVNVQWHDVFKGFEMYEEAGKYVLEFIYKEEK